MSKGSVITGIAAKRFCECLGDLRKFRGWTQRQLGIAAGMRTASISVIEAERRGLSKVCYATLRFTLQASLYDMPEDDARVFSYVLETLLDPSTDDTTFAHIRDKVHTAAPSSCVANANAVRDLIALSIDHRIKYTSDPDGLDWYYDLVGMPIASKKFKSLD